MTREHKQKIEDIVARDHIWNVRYGLGVIPSNAGQAAYDRRVLLCIIRDLDKMDGVGARAAVQKIRHAMRRKEQS